jgi:cytochrome c biogenesis protein CcmG/thiol:disulfide interchange protein DsbE
MPAIQDRYESSKSEGLVVLAVNFDESSEAVTAYGAELGLMFPLLLDPGGEIQKRYRNRSYPTSFFVDAEGIIRAHHIGVMTEGQLDENLTKIGIGG